MFYTGSAWGDISRTLGNLYGGGLPQIDLTAGFAGLDIDLSGLAGTTVSRAVVDSGIGPGQGLARTNEQIKQAEETAKQIGTIDFKKTNFDADRLPEVADPDKLFAEEAKKDYELEVGLTREFEKDLVKKTKDQALIDTALDDIAVQQNLAQGIVDRSRSRYGIATTGAFNLEQRRAIDRGRVNIASDALNNARISQDEQNTALLNELSNISNTINKQITQMGSSAALQTTNMENSYKAAKSQHKSNKYGIIGSFIGAL